jgi:hypothetical protein
MLERELAQWGKTKHYNIKISQDGTEMLKKELAHRDVALKETEEVLAKRSEQCRQLYDIVGTNTQYICTEYKYLCSVFREHTSSRLKSSIFGKCKMACRIGLL